MVNVLKKGSVETALAEVNCTGSGNDRSGCGALLQIDSCDVYITESHHHDGSSESYLTFMCPDCGTETDIDSKFARKNKLKAEGKQLNANKLKEIRTAWVAQERTKK